MSKAIKYFRRHRKAVGAFLEIACDAVPTAGMLKPFLNIAQAIDEDREKEKLNEKVVKLEAGQAENQAQFEKLLEVIMKVPEIRDIVEEIEENKDFNKNLSKDDVVKIIEKDQELYEEFKSTVPKISGDLTASVQYFQRITPQAQHQKYDQRWQGERSYAQNMSNNTYLGGKYRLQERLGGGGQGEVYRAFNEIAEKEVAIKVLPSELSKSKEGIEALKDDYRNLTANLSHRFIVQYRNLDYCNERNRWFLVMDYIQGTTLRSTIIENKAKRISAQNIYSLLSPVAEALEYAHSKKISHNDIKPENILVGNDGHIMLTDFGLAEQIRNTVSMVSGKTGDMTGTWPYMAPEQIQSRRTSGATDVWSLGVIIYEMVEGKHPFYGGKNFGDYHRMICEEKVPRVSNDSIWGVLQQAFVKDKKQRIQSPKELLEQIRQAGEERYIARKKDVQKQLVKDSDSINSIGESNRKYTEAQKRKRFEDMQAPRIVDYALVNKNSQEKEENTLLVALKQIGLAGMLITGLILSDHYLFSPQQSKRRKKERVQQHQIKPEVVNQDNKLTNTEREIVKVYLEIMDRSQYAYIKKEEDFSPEVLAEINKNAKHYAEEDMNAARKALKTYNEWDRSRDLSSVIENYKNAARYGNAKALYYLGEFTLKGEPKINLKKDVKRAKEYFELAVLQGSKVAQKRLKELEASILDKLEKSKVVEDVYIAATMYEKGDQVNVNYKKAIELYERAAEKKHGDSLYRLIAIYTEGKVVKRNFKKASKYYKDLGRLGEIKPLDTLLNLYIEEYKNNQELWINDGINEVLDIYWEKHRQDLSEEKIRKIAQLTEDIQLGKKSKLQEYRWHELLAGEGDVDAMYKCGMMYSQHREKIRGWGYRYFNENYWLERASEKGHVKATKFIAELYEKKGTKADLKKALNLYKKIEKNLGLESKVKEIENVINGKVANSEEVFKLKRNSPEESARYLQQANNYFTGKGGKKDYTKSIQLYKKSAELGNLEAMYKLGLIYMYGEVTETNLNKSKMYLEHASKSKDVHAMNMLGVILYMQNDVKARDLFLKGAYQGYSPAINNLANIYFYGKGVKKDVDKAMQYYRRSANLNNPEAYFNLGIIYYTGKHVDYNRMRRSHRKLMKKRNNLQAKNFFQISADLKYEPAKEFLKLINKSPGVIARDDIMHISYGVKDFR